MRRTGSAVFVSYLFIKPPRLSINHRNVLIHLESVLYSHQGGGRSGVYPRNTVYEVRIHPEWDTSPSLDIMNTYSYQGAVQWSQSTNMFLGGERNLDVSSKSVSQK